MVWAAPLTGRNFLSALLHGLKPVVSNTVYLRHALHSSLTTSQAPSPARSALTDHFPCSSPLFLSLLTPAHLSPPLTTLLTPHSSLTNHTTQPSTLCRHDSFHPSLPLLSHTLCALTARQASSPTHSPSHTLSHSTTTISARPIKKRPRAMVVRGRFLCDYVLVFQVNHEIEFIELLLVERCRCVEHHVTTAVVLRERDAVAD